MYIHCGLGFCVFVCLVNFVSFVAKIEVKIYKMYVPPHTERISYKIIDYDQNNDKEKKNMMHTSEAPANPIIYTVIYIITMTQSNLPNI